MKIETATIIRTICLVLALINQILAIKGISPLPISDEQITELVSTGMTIVVAFWTWWKNNSFTQSALMADEYMKKINKNRK